MSSSGENQKDSLETVEDELLLLLKESITLLASLKTLPQTEDAVRVTASSLLKHLSKVQDGLFDNINLLVDYLPYERSATQSRLKARQAQADINAACSALEAPIDDIYDSSGDSDDATGGNNPPAKRVRYE